MSSVKRRKVDDSPDALVLTEHPDVAKLEWVVLHPDTRNVRGMHNYARAVDSSGALTVAYERCGPGRLYPKSPRSIGTVAVSQSRRVRATLFADTHIDVDIVNCQPRLLYALVRDCDEISADKYACLEEYVQDRDAVFAREGLPKELAKKLVCTALFGGSLKRFSADTGFDGELSAWWTDFVTKIKMLAKLVWRHAVGDDEQRAIESYLASDAYKARHPDKVRADGTVKIHGGVRLSMVLQKRETDAVLDAMAELGRRGVPVESYQFDGFLVSVKHRATVEQWMVECNTPDVEYIIKPFDTPLVRPPFRRFDPMDFRLGEIKPDDVPARQLRQRLGMEQYMLKTMTPPGFIFLPDGPASSNRDPRSFREGRDLFSNVTVPVVKTKPGDKGPERVVESTPFFPWWLQLADMRQYNDVQFRPPPLILADGHYNMWRGFKIEEVVPRPVDIESFLGHCTVLMEDNAEWGEYLLDLLAHRVQRPGERTEVALVLIGAQGTGKTTFFQRLCQALLHDHNYLITEKAEQITGKFHLLYEKILVLWEEAESQDTNNAADRIKHLTTAEDEYSEKKCKDARKHPMCFLPIITANHIGRKSVNIEATDRRWVVMRTGTAHLANPDYFSKLFSAKDGMGDPAFMRSVFDFLRARDISKYKNGRDWSKARPISETYKDLQQACAPPFQRWLDHIAEALASGEGGLDCLRPLDGQTAWSEAFKADDVFPAYTRWLQHNGYEYGVTLSTFQHALAALAAPWCTKVKTSVGLRRYKIDSTGMVLARLGRDALPQHIRAWFASTQS